MYRLHKRDLSFIKGTSNDNAFHPSVASLTDIGAREFWMLAILAVAVLLVGIWPQPLVGVMETTLSELLNHVAQSKL